MKLSRCASEWLTFGAKAAVYSKVFVYSSSSVAAASFGSFGVSRFRESVYVFVCVVFPPSSKHRKEIKSYFKLR